MKKVIGIIGGGPAGMSCALWLNHLGFQPILVEKGPQLGGLQTINPFHNRWYLGVMGQTGVDLAQQFQQQMKLDRIPTLFNTQLLHITPKPTHGFTLTLTDRTLDVNGLVIATGQRFRGPEAIASIPGSDRLTASQRVSFSPGIIPNTPGQTVAIVGGGDNGLGIATILADAAQHIHLFVRSNLRAFGITQTAILDYVNAGRITLHKPAAIQQFQVNDEAIALTFTEADAPAQTLSVDYLALRLGFAPNVEPLVALFDAIEQPLPLTASGHIDTDTYLRTPIAGVYAIGDVTNPRDPCVATAVAQGAIAARSIDEDFR